MSIDIKFTSAKISRKGTLVISMAHKGKLGALASILDETSGGAITKAIGVKKFEGAAGAHFTLLAPANVELDRIIVVGLGDIKKMTTHDAEMFGGTAWGAAAQADAPITFLLEKPKGLALPYNQWVARIASGAMLRGYKFDTYKVKTKKPEGTRALTISSAARMDAVKKDFKELKAIVEGTILARDLMNEPANILSPPEFAKRARTLSKVGVKVEVLSESQMEKKGMGALLGVGQGSVHPSQLVVMQWQGAAKSVQPIAFVGKGVCFDTGGISIKPAGGMEDMKGDMGGAAAVVGLMHSLASRKAKVNAVGVIGLVENMPDGNAQRPGDIVTSMSGQTIEVLNTDAEGRLVLADALWYTQETFKPRFMIDLATLTGAIMVALGQDYAGLFSNNDKLSAQLDAIGKQEGEKVWRMPLCESFDKMINTPNADMKNIGGRYAGSSTAGQFLQRFANDVAWAHLDIAGTAMGAPKHTLNQSWGSGFGVRLLDRLVKTHYERKR
ncbi:MAG: leucyl aminopeptidase [Alphaproteobacteria bacterium]|nr:leucyl aminopeptidase [Alphaproteobacteria bacterium]